MSFFSDFLLEYFKNYDIYFLAILIILKFTGLPTGSSFLVMASGAFAYYGEFDIVTLLFEICFFSCLGDLLGYFLWGFIGDKVLERFATLRRYFEPKIVRSGIYLKQYGGYLIFFSRFLISAIAPFVNAACGISKYNLGVFSIYVFLGNFLWTIIYLGLGYWFSDSWELIVPIVTVLGELFTCITILLVIIYIFIKIIKNKRLLK